MNECLMRDEWFIRGKVPMTKSEVRAIALEKLELLPESVLFDVGAGTGSVSVEAASRIRSGMVYAIEKKREAVRLIEKNRERFGAERLSIVEGEAPAAFKGLLLPTHAFIGGTSGKMEEILDWLLDCNPHIRMVINAITLESITASLGWAGSRGIAAELTQVQISRSRTVGGLHMMMGQNPVWIMAFGGPQGLEKGWSGDEE